MERKFSLDLNDLYEDTDRCTSVTVYHEDDIVTEIVDERGKVWPLSVLSPRDQDRVNVAVINEVQASREWGHEDDHSR